MEYEIKQLLFESESELQAVVDLQNIVYEGKHIFCSEGFKHWYLENPMGKVISFNAFYGKELVAHYACIPYKMEIEGRVATGLLDMATVTHPKHRGKGLFKKLAKTTYDYAQNNGYEFVLGVANANSFPGYIKYFPFTYMGKLDVKMGFGLDIKEAEGKTYKTHWDIDSMRWRSKCCTHNYRVDNDIMLGKFKGVVQTIMGCFDNKLMKASGLCDNKWTFKPRLYVGLGAKFGSFYMNVPKFIKHSPFNLIFLDLTDGKLSKPTREKFFFQLFDFDVV